MASSSDRALSEATALLQRLLPALSSADNSTEETQALAALCRSVADAVGGSLPPAARGFERTLQSEDQTIATLQDSGYWLQLCPELHCSDDLERFAAMSAPLGLGKTALDECERLLCERGYIQLPAPRLEWGVSLASALRVSQRARDGSESESGGAIPCQWLAEGATLTVRADDAPLYTRIGTARARCRASRGARMEPALDTDVRRDLGAGGAAADNGRLRVWRSQREQL